MCRAGRLRERTAAALRQYAASPVYRSDLDMMTYGAPAAYRQPPMYGQRPAPTYTAQPGYRPPPAPTYAPAPVYRQPPPAAYVPQPAPSRTVRYATRYVPPPVEQGPYTLDTGDKLRIVVFGQDTLSNTYTVDAAGQVTMPLIGAVVARDLTTAAARRRDRAPGSPAASSASRASRSRSRSTGRSSCSAR